MTIIIIIIILKFIIKKQSVRMSSELVCRKISLMVHCCEHGNESYGFINAGEFFD